MEIKMGGATYAAICATGSSAGFAELAAAAADSGGNVTRAMKARIATRREGIVGVTWG